MKPARCRRRCSCVAAEAERQRWQVAIECPICAAEKGGIVMMARIAMLRALNHGALIQRRERAKRYRIVR